VAARYGCGDARAVGHGADLREAADRDLERHEPSEIHSSAAFLESGSQ
jgi:hypothetical protein